MVTVESGSGQSGSGQRGSGPSDPFAGFGPNEWLVYEMYQQYLKDPQSVDKAWGDFFAAYQPADTRPSSGPPPPPAPAKNNGSAEKPVGESPKAPAASAAPSKEKDAEEESPTP